MKIKELLVLVAPREAKEKKKGSIILLASSTMPGAAIGDVVEAGPGTEAQHMNIQKGDVILYRASPNHIEVGDNILVTLDSVLMNYKDQYNEE